MAQLWLGKMTLATMDWGKPEGCDGSHRGEQGALSVQLVCAGDRDVLSKKPVHEGRALSDVMRISEGRCVQGSWSC